MNIIEEAKKTVEDYLNTVSYGHDPKYKPSKFAINFINFIKLVNGGEGEENTSPVVHYHMLDNITFHDKDMLNMCHRGLGKTAVFAEYLTLYLAVFGELEGFGKIDLGIYVSDSMENGVKNMRKNLEFRWENSAFLQQYVPTTKFTDARWEFKNADGKILIFKGYGAKTGVRGAKEMGKRPQLAILDDLISDDDARSPTVIASVEDTVYKAVDYALHPTRRKIIWSGTPFNAKDPLYKAVESGAWNVNVFPVCEKFPCERNEFRGSWEDRFNYDYVMKQYNKAVKSGKVDTFNQELMLRIMSEDDRLILDTDIKWYSYHSILKYRHSFNFYITTDFATSETNASDFSVISVWAYNSNGDWFWVDGICKKQTMDKNINDLFRLAQKWRPLSVGIEVSGQQGGFVPWIEDEMIRRRCSFVLASENNKGKPGIRPNTNKIQRFNVVVPWFKQGKIYFPKEHQYSECMLQAIDELSLVAKGGFKSKHDDFSDTISMLSLIDAWKPSDDIKYGQEDDSPEAAFMFRDDDGDSENDSAMDSYVV